MANTANEIMRRFEENSFHPISITMNATGETLELKVEKIDGSQKFHAGNLAVSVLKNNYEIAVGGIEPIASYLYAYGTDKTDALAEYTAAIT